MKKEFLELKENSREEEGVEVVLALEIQIQILQ
jgi:hypothetical protein